MPDTELAAAIVRLGLLPEQELTNFREETRSDNRPFQDALIEDGLVNEENLFLALRLINPAEEPAPSRVREFGKYIIIDELGRGSAGIVHLAWDPDLARPVALKILTGLGVFEQEQILRFQREARLAAKLRHPGIVTVHDAGVHDSFPYITMEYVEGSNLGRKIRQLEMQEVGLPVIPGRETFDLRKRVEIVRHVAEAVHAAHLDGVIHRDLKPENILIDRNGLPRVVDFSLAREIADMAGLTASGVTVGTPAYMSPEQAAGESISLDASTDIYSLGVVLYYMLTLHLPFEEFSVPKILRRVLEDDPITPGKMNPALDRDIETVCLKAMEKEPHRRYATALEFAQDLDNWLKGRPVRARRAGTVRRIVHKARRLKWASAFVVALLLTGGLFAAYLFTRPAAFSFEVTPGDARIEINGEVAQETNIKLPPGAHKIRVLKDGYRVVEEEIHIGRGERVTRQYDLEMLGAVAEIRTERPGLQIQIEGNEFRHEGVTPFGPVRLSPGSYRVRIFGRDRALHESGLEIKDGRDIRLDPKVPTAVRWKTRTRRPESDLQLMHVDQDAVPDIVFATSRTLVAVSGRSGDVLWETSLRSWVTGGPVLDDGDLLIGLSTGRILTIRGSSGEIISDQPSGERPRLASLLVDADGDGSPDIIYADRDGNLTAMARSGAVLWTAPHKGAVIRPPVVHEDEVLFTTTGSVCVHDLGTGREKGIFPAGGELRTIPLLHDLDGKPGAEVVVGCTAGNVVCLDPKTGSSRWVFRAGGRIRDGAVTADLDGNGTPEVLVGSDDQHLYALSGSDGSVLWKFKAGSEVQTHPQFGDVDGDGKPEVVFGCDDDRVYVLDPRNGNLIWWFQSGEDINRSVRLVDIDADGVLEIVAVSNDNHVYCLSVVRR